MDYQQKDSAVLKECSQGSSEAFGIIVQKYQNVVCAMTYSATGDQYQSEELAQDVFVLAWQNLSKLRDTNKFKSWLYTITRNRIRQHYRNIKRDLLNKAEPIENIDTVDRPDDGPLDKLITEEHCLMVKYALDQMPENYRVPLVLYYREEKSIKQVADHLDLSVDAAKKRISRGRKLLKAASETVFEKVISDAAPKKEFAGAVVGLLAVDKLAQSAAAASELVPVFEHSKSFLVHLLLSKTAALVSISAITLFLTGMAINNYVEKAAAIPQREILSVLPDQLNKGLVLHLPFEYIENRVDGQWVPDQSSSANDGQLIGGKLVDGIIGSALKLDAANQDQYVVVPDDDSLDLDNVTICAWIRTNHLDNQWNRILDKGWDTAYNLCIGGDYENWLYREFVYLECGEQSIRSKRKVTDGKWHFIAASYDGNSMNMYIDGQFDSKVAYKKAMPLKHNDVDIHIGKLAVPEEPPYNIPFFTGMIDEIRLYNRVLSNWEFNQLYRYQPQAN